jgi:hypothetical protein
MKNGEFPVINPKRSWTKRQWALYRRLPWIGRRLIDVMVLTPRLSRWVCGQVMRLGGKPVHQSGDRVPRLLVGPAAAPPGARRRKTAAKTQIRFKKPVRPPRLPRATLNC